MEIPESMKEELAAWNNGNGIDLESWVACSGSFALAVGYAAIFWPRIVEHKGYLLREGFSEAILEGCESSCQGNRQGIEAVMNHRHITDLQYVNSPDLARDKVILLGNMLKEMYEAKLAYQFPDRPCEVRFYGPGTDAELDEYEVTFWQKDTGESA